MKERKPRKKQEKYSFMVQVPKGDAWRVHLFRENVAKKTGKLWGVMSNEFVIALDLYNKVAELGLTEEEAIEILENSASPKRRRKK